MQSPAEEISSLLHAWCEGDRTALDTLMPLVYDELHRLAHNYMMQERANHTLQTTALVNEAYVRLIGAERVEWKDRNHFFAISANLMRRILVDFARSRGYRKRSGKVKKVSLDSKLLTPSLTDPDIVKLDDALNALAELYPRKARVVELIFFGGLSAKEAASVLEVSLNTVRRDWSMAKAWLLCELSDGEKRQS
jgi:RNA polymerase sigma factor (TIGR02999 family)